MGASVTLWEATAPVKLPTWHRPKRLTLSGDALVRTKASEEWYFTVASKRPKSLSSQAPTYPTHPRPQPYAKL